MKLTPFESSEWESRRTLSGAKASTLVSALRRLASSDWSSSVAVNDWLAIRQEAVDGAEVSDATKLIVPWIVELSRGRGFPDVLQAWASIGEFELARLIGGGAEADEAALAAAAELANEQAGRGTAKSQNEHDAMIGSLTELPDWGRLLVLRLVLLGHRYAHCPTCGELLDLEWNGRWLVDGHTVDPRPTPLDRRPVVDISKSRALAHHATALMAVEE